MRRQRELKALHKKNGEILESISAKINEAEKNFLELEKLGDYLKSDAYMERQARLKLNYKKPDEKVVYIYQKTAETQNEEETQNDLGLNKILENKVIMNLKNWLRYLVSK